MILVTGAGGVVGTAVVEALAREGAPVRLAHHSEQKAAAARARGQDALAVDFARPDTLAPALEGVEALFLLGAGGESQIQGESNVVEAAERAGVRHVVKLSVWRAKEEAYQFARIHRKVEQTIEKSGLTYTFLRPNGFMQNFLTYMGASIRQGDAFHQPAADARISHVDVRDIARVAARALRERGHEGKAYELSGPAALSYAEAAAVLSRVLERPIRYVALSDEDARGGMVGAGIPADYADALVDLNRLYRTGAGAALSPDVQSVTGREPGTFEQFVRDHREAWIP